MRYITDIHALNLPCSLGTTGDWHRFGIQWKEPRMLATEDLPWGTWGIECDSDSNIPEHENKRFSVANHVRAIADMIALGRFSVAQGSSEDYLDGHDYDEEIVTHIAMLKDTDNWDDISRFMEQEYGETWTRVKSV